MMPEISITVQSTYVISLLDLNLNKTRRNLLKLRPSDFRKMPLLSLEKAHYGKKKNDEIIVMHVKMVDILAVLCKTVRCLTVKANT